jgi:hypothetical protein
MSEELEQTRQLAAAVRARSPRRSSVSGRDGRAPPDRAHGAGPRAARRPAGNGQDLPRAVLRLRSTGLEFGRIQFTPDLLPGDILGSNLFNFQTSQFTLTRGPIFRELLLADEINRTPPKTQAALLEAMQERRVTLDGQSHSAARTLHGRGHAEPDRAPGRLSAARGAARPLPVQAAGALPERRGRSGDRRPLRRAQRAAEPGRFRHRRRRRRRGARRGAAGGQAASPWRPK